MTRSIVFLVVFSVLLAPLAGALAFETDRIPTPKGDLGVTFIGHGSLAFAWGGMNIQVDPYGKVADYGAFPKADLILLTHHHGDHLDPEALGKVRGEKTVVVATELCAPKVPGAVVMKNGDLREVSGVGIEAVPAYNVKHLRPTGEPYHVKGQGNGYVLTFGGVRVYVAGDTEDIPEMRALKDIDVAFLPMNLPFTMTPEMVAEAARAFRPKILYPYHTGETDVSKLVALLKDDTGIEVRVRSMK